MCCGNVMSYCIFVLCFQKCCVKSNKRKLAQEAEKGELLREITETVPLKELTALKKKYHSVVEERETLKELNQDGQRALCSRLLGCGEYI